MRGLLAGAAFSLLPSLGKAQADSVVLRVTSPRGTEVMFNGVITLRGAQTERRLENVRTPFELKLPAQHIEARFAAADGGALSGDLATYREGKQRGHVTGTVYVGDVTLYAEPGVGFGFGPRRSRPVTP